MGSLWGAHFYLRDCLDSSVGGLAVRSFNRCALAYSLGTLGLTRSKAAIRRYAARLCHRANHLATTIYLNRVVLFALLGFFPLTGAMAYGFMPDDRLVSDPSVSILDPEFDSVGNLMVWQDEAGDMWLADVDTATGHIIPATGQGTMVDSGLANPVYTGNGPEFGYGADETSICYTRLVVGTPYLAVARQDQAGNWISGIQENANDRYRPLCTKPGTPDTARMVYVNASDSLQKSVSWRIIDEAGSERTFTTIGDVGGQWADGERAFVSPALVDGFRQLFWVDIDTGEAVQITFDNTDKHNIILWQGPEYNDLLLSASIDYTEVGIYRRIGGDWQRIYIFKLPSELPLLNSPEPFVHNGRSYIAVVAARELVGASKLSPTPKALPRGPSELWIANIDSADPFFRRIDSTTPARKVEPEPFMLATGPAVYFTQTDLISRNATLHVADTGLGSATAGDSDDDGVSDDRDNCTLVANASQIDTDSDGIGNRCDPDFNNDCLVGYNDFLVFKSRLGSSLSPLFDLNEDGIVNWEDYLTIMKQYMLMMPGEAAAPNVCDGV